MGEPAYSLDDVERIAREWLGPRAVRQFIRALREHGESSREEEEVEISDIDRAHARRIARRHGFHVRKGQER